MKKWIKVIILFVFAGCTSAKVVYDFDPKTDFSKYQSFLYFSDAGEGLNQLDIKRFKRAISSELDSINIRVTDFPDFYINIIVERNRAPQNSNIGFGMGTGGRNAGVGISTGFNLNSNKISETIIIDFVDAKSNKLFWQARSKKIISERIEPKERVIYVREVIANMLSKFPPSS